MEKNENTIEGVVNVKMIKDFMQTNNYSAKEFSKMCNISLHNLMLVLSDREDYDVCLLFKIARTMKIGIHKLFLK